MNADGFGAITASLGRLITTMPWDWKSRVIVIQDDRMSRTMEQTYYVPPTKRSYASDSTVNQNDMQFCTIRLSLQTWQRKKSSMALQYQTHVIWLMDDVRGS